jgi:hypothetical protein
MTMHYHRTIEEVQECGCPEAPAVSPNANHYTCLSRDRGCCGKDHTTYTAAKRCAAKHDRLVVEVKLGTKLARERYAEFRQLWKDLPWRRDVMTFMDCRF